MNTFSDKNYNLHILFNNSMSQHNNFVINEIYVYKFISLHFVVKRYYFIF